MDSRAAFKGRLISKTMGLMDEFIHNSHESTLIISLEMHSEYETGHLETKHKQTGNISTELLYASIYIIPDFSYTCRTLNALVVLERTILRERKTNDRKLFAKE